MKEIKENNIEDENVQNLESPDDVIDTTTESSDVNESEIIESIEDSNNVVTTDLSQTITNEDDSSIFKPVNTNEKVKTKKITTKLIVILIITILILLFLSTIFALLNLSSDKIISGVSIKGIDVSGLTKEEATNKLSEIVTDKLSTTFELTHNDYSETVSSDQFDVTFDIETSVNTAFERGRGKNIFKSNYEILSSFFYKVNIIPSFSYNEDSVTSLISEMESNLTDRLVEPSYYIDGKNLVITKGIDGIVIDSDLLKLKILTNISAFDTSIENIEIPVINTVAQTIDIDKIHSEIYKEPHDAYYTQNPFTVYPHENGVDFEITIDEAKQLLQESKESYIIPLKITTPSVTTNDIGTEAFPNLLATYSTTYSTKNVNRSTNISLATAKINGTVIMPGETFSYNSTVGQRTAAAGFKSAGVYVGGQVTTGIGGGICQVSSTLYNSVLLSNLGIVERYNHGFNPGYVPAGRDATVSWGGPDFKFKNTRNYPVKIVANTSGGTITIKIYGLKEENEYEVEIQSYITSYISYKTITQQDSTLAKGTTKVIANGSNGCKSVAYRILKQNGQVISKTLLSTDTYNPHNKTVAVGTKE